jgi:hypothetical protein
MSKPLALADHCAHGWLANSSGAFGKLLVSLWLLVLLENRVEDAFLKPGKGDVWSRGNRGIGYQLFPAVGFLLNTFKGLIPNL